MIFALFAAGSSPAFAGEQACRIRVHNEPGGLVQVSLDGGETWGAVGRVKHPANARISGFAAASYAPQGTVAATAVHGIRIKTGQYSLGVGKAQKSMLFSIEPLEFASIPNGYGGHRPRSSGIYTDIFAGHSIFRNDSPYVGNSVFVERHHKLQPLPEDYTPIVGETFVIIVTRPGPELVRDIPPGILPGGMSRTIWGIEFENKAQGKVTVRYPDGSSEVIASVDRPVKGVGRYDGTTFTGVGAVNTNHGGVLTISTAPTCLPMTQEGGATETRGGFMIQPRYHVSEQGDQSPQVMVIGPQVVRGHTQVVRGHDVPAQPVAQPVMEGAPPLFSGNINLTRHWGKPANSFTAQVQIDNGPWEDMPQIIGRVNDAFTPAYLNAHYAAKGRARDIKQGVTGIRLLFPKYDSALLSRDLAQEVSDYTARVKDIKPVKDTIVVAPSKPDANRLVSFYVDGKLVYIASRFPMRWDWDTTKAPNGLHEVEIETEGSGGAEKRTVLVEN